LGAEQGRKVSEEHRDHPGGKVCIGAVEAEFRCDQYHQRYQSDVEEGAVKDAPGGINRLQDVFALFDPAGVARAAKRQKQLHAAQGSVSTSEIQRRRQG
jgi:hypothetical protein